MCTKPITIKNKSNNQFFSVPCGLCMECRLQAKQNLVNRTFLESLSHWKNSFFITLTYNDKNLPVSNCGKPVLVKSHFQNFIKRLKNFYKDSKIAYLYCGEYGELNFRCHWHLILFCNFDIDNKDISQIWKNGFTKVGTVTNASINYVASYVTTKSKFNPKDITTFKCPEVFYPEFSRCSNFLGLTYVENNLDFFLKNGFIVNGKKVSFPKYFYENLPVLKVRSTKKQIRKDTQKVNNYDKQVISSLVDKQENYNFYNSSSKNIFKEVQN